MDHYTMVVLGISMYTYLLLIFFPLHFHYHYVFFSVISAINCLPHCIILSSPISVSCFCSVLSIAIVNKINNCTATLKLNKQVNTTISHCRLCLISSMRQQLKILFCSSRMWRGFASLSVSA